MKYRLTIETPSQLSSMTIACDGSAADMARLVAHGIHICLNENKSFLIEDTETRKIMLIGPALLEKTIFYVEKKPCLQ